MKLSDEHVKSYIDDVRMVDLLRWMTYEGKDVVATWIGKYQPATRSDDEQLIDMARFSRDHYFLYLQFVANHMEKRGKVLDIGCGTGHRAFMLTRYAYHVSALDYCEEKLAFALKMNGAGPIQYYLGTFPRDVLPLGIKYDYIFAVEVIEHVELEAQREFVRAALEILRPGGKLFLTTPKDPVVKRVPPHIGLWEPETRDTFLSDFPENVRYSGYASVSSLGHTLDVTLADMELGEVDGTHYVVVLGT